jgi:hypothetical protein
VWEEVEVDALDWSVYCVEPAHVAAVQARKELVELVDDGLDTPEDYTLRRSEVSVCPACSSQAADQGKHVNGLHIEAGRVDVHGYLTL